MPVDPAGVVGPTAGQARGPQWRRVCSGLFVPADVDSPDLDQQIVEATADLPPYGGLTGWAALSWDRARWFGQRDGRPITLAIGGGNLRTDARRALSKERLAPFDLECHDGLLVTRPVRSVCFEMRYARSVQAAVRVLDLAAYDDLVSIEECRRYVDGYLAGWTGVQQCRDAIGLADENVWSPMEHEMRFVWTDVAGLARPRCNPPIFDLEGRHLGTPDLFDPERGVAGEYEGTMHLVGAQRAKDLVREELFRSHGLHSVTMVNADRAAPGAFVARLMATYARSEQAPSSERRWTLTKPPWWIATETVAQRRALTDRDRDWLLAHRAS